MKNILKNIIALFNKFVLLLNNNISFNHSTFFFVTVAIQNQNKVKLLKTTIEKTRIYIKGENNEIFTNNSRISNSSIEIIGNNNKIILESNIKLTKAIIIVRGNNCSIKIGENTSFEGIRIVNIGKKNYINIGRNCLFSDNIELWASDTHTILDQNNKMINAEKPIEIGDRVWVGSHVMILKGVVIENDSVIGMGSIVTKNVPAKSINVGIPNRTIKKNITWKTDYE